MKPTTQVPGNIFMTGDGGAVGRTLPSEVSSAPPLTTHLKDRVGTWALHFGKACLPLVWAVAFSSHLFPQKVLSKLLFLYFEPATAGQPENRRKKENFTAIFQHE